ncbi:MAG: cysteine--tRNA ligase [Gammaproteobacteria bacterium]|nr:cysteine--tRNA ligase [Gammaproteobacteria bacterium]
MELQFHNTLSGRKEVFKPLDPNRITVYACGPTVYNLVHIGNGRPAVVFDVLFRLLRTIYPEVAYARNVTDVDDKINAAALAQGISIATLADRFTEEYQKDIMALGALEPTVEPRATQHIPEIVVMIQELIDKDHAYEADGHVLFDVSSDPSYGTLARRSLEDMLDGARVEIAPYKRDPKDFVLWKPSTDELPGWESPWGFGRPGWHIECSAMIREHLGQTIDIHGGGSDLTFPHHENEAAQSRSVNDNAEYVRYWLHNGMLTLGDEKMSKSTGNIVTIRELLDRYSGETLRYALLSGQYRSQLAWSEDLLKQATASLDRLYGALREAPGNETSSAYRDTSVDEFPASVTAALGDDLNTPQALAALHAIAGDIHKTSDAEQAQALRSQLLAGGWLLGLLDRTVEAYFQQGRDIDPGQIDTLIAQRISARQNKDYARADEIREELTALGVELEDTADGTRWKLRGDTK